MSAQLLLAAALLLPALGALLVGLAGRWPNLREAITLLTSVLLLCAIAPLVPRVLAGEQAALALLEIMPGLSLKLSVEPLGMLFALIASSLWLVNSLYSIGYMRANEETRQTRFYVCFALAIAAAIGIAFAGNLFTLFVFYELLTLVTYPLVTHHGTEQARQGGRVYLGLLMGTSIVFLLPALIWVWALTGSTDFVAGGLLAGRIEGWALGGMLALFVFGIGKAAMMPFHRWLPAAMVAPTPVSALLHAVAVVKAGVFSVVKVVVYIIGVDQLREGFDPRWLLGLAGFTLVAASVVALGADNLKRRLAYSTISQLAYVVLAVAILVPLSITGAALHIAAHAFGKITLFFAAGAIYTAAHKTEVSQLDGIGRRMPITMGAFAIGSLSMIGLPPTAGFVSKWYILSGAMESSQWWAVAVLAASTLLSCGYLLPVLYRAFFREPPAGEGGQVAEAPWPMLLALSLTATATVALFFLPDLPLALARQLSGVPSP